MYRFATTLLDHRACPAAALTALYHERWQHEITYLALRHTLLYGQVLRSGDPAGVQQQMWALVALYQALRTAIAGAVQALPGTGPDRASYQIAVATTQNLATTTVPGGQVEVSTRPTAEGALVSAGNTGPVIRRTRSTLSSSRSGNSAPNGSVTARATGSASLSSTPSPPPMAPASPHAPAPKAASTSR